MPNAPFIRAEGVGKVYRSKTGPIPALTNVSFGVDEGALVSVIGPSGSGKTTLIKIVGDLVQPSEGVVTIGGASAAQARASGIFSWVFQNPALLSWRRVLANVALPLEVLGVKGRDPLELLSVVGLEGFENKFPRELSGGMQQRVALARALTFNPKVLLMDEPFGALDEFTRNTMQFELLRIWREIRVSILFVTHSIAEAVFLSDQIILLSARPGTVREIVPVPFARPRPPSLKDQPEFEALVRCLRKKLE